jgi:hypothetical protein
MSKKVSKRKEIQKKILLKTPRNYIRSGNEPLRQQYFVIRNDLEKLRNDLAKGYDLTKEWLEKRNMVRNILMKAK